MTQDYLGFAQQVMASHDRANKQAEQDVSPAMGDMLTEMQGCLKQLCGNSAVDNPEAKAQYIAEKVAAMNISLSHNSMQDICDNLLALPAPADMAALEMHVDRSARAQGCTTGLNTPALYDTHQWQHQLSPACMVSMEPWIHYNCREGQAHPG